ncbi:MAG: DUF2892 domain-containing protein [Clostridia bacterium]|nr:DUF2892 domain-containing protein [Clostridia bacterium]
MTISKHRLPPTAGRVVINTRPRTRQKLHNDTICRIKSCQGTTKPLLAEEIERLDYEWDTERVVETIAASLLLAASMTGFGRGKLCHYILTGAIGFGLLQQALRGWNPALPLIRALGVRSPEEIYQHKTTLKRLRGDFCPDSDDAELLLTQAEK